jgi:hypothetical protein
VPIEFIDIKMKPIDASTSDTNQLIALFQVQPSTDVDVSIVAGDWSHAVELRFADDVSGQYRLETRAGVIIDGANMSVDLLAVDQNRSRMHRINVQFVETKKKIVAFADHKFNFSVNECHPKDTIVGWTRSAEASTGIRYSIVDAVDNAFRIDMDTGLLLIADSGILDYESVRQRQFTIKASIDNDVVVDRASVHIDVIDCNDNTPQFVDAPKLVAIERGNVSVGDVIVRLSARDKDAADGDNSRFTFSLVNHDSKLPFIVDMYTGEVCSSVTNYIRVFCKHDHTKICKFITTDYLKICIFTWGAASGRSTLYTGLQYKFA